MIDQPITDTPLSLPVPPPPLLDQIKTFIGDLARPFAIIATSAGASVSMVIIAIKTENGNDGAILMGAIAALVTGLFIGKAWENAKSGKHAAEVEVAKANAGASQ